VVCLENSQIIFLDYDLNFVCDVESSNSQVTDIIEFDHDSNEIVMMGGVNGIIDVYENWVLKVSLK